MNSRRLGARDYKRPHRGGLGVDAAQLRSFALGLGLGLAVAAIIYIGDHRVRAAITDALRPVPQQRAPDELGLGPLDAAAPAADAEASASERAQRAGHADSGDGSGAGDGGTDGSAAEAARGASAAAPDGSPTHTDGAAPPATVGRFDFYQMLPRARVVVAAHEHISSVAPTAPIEQPGTYFLQVGSYRDAAVAERVRAEVARLGIGATVQRIAVGADAWHRVRVGPVRDLAALNRLRKELRAAKLDSLVVRVED